MFSLSVVLAATYYDYLDILPDSTSTDVRAAYQKQLLYLEGRPAPSAAEAEQKEAILAKIEEAFAVLSDPIRRSAYDKKLALTNPKISEKIKSPSEPDTRPRARASLAECVLGATLALQIPMEALCEEQEKCSKSKNRDSGLGVQLHIPPWSSGNVEAIINPLLPGFGGPEGELLDEFLALGPKTVVVECEPVEEVEGTRFWMTESGDLVADITLSSEEVKNGFDRSLRLGGVDFHAKWVGEVHSDELVPAGSIGTLRLLVHGISDIFDSRKKDEHFYGENRSS